MKRYFMIMLLIVPVFITGLSQVTTSGEKIRIYSSPMNPRLHPDDGRRLVKPPDSRTFNNRIQFMALRSLDGDYKKLLDKYTLELKLGNIIWPSYPVLFRDDLPQVMSELKKRGLYLFDLWGYVPGSGPGGYWQQFVVPEHATEIFKNELGDHWLGMDNGEQDGRYVGGYAGQLNPAGGSRADQYLNFQNHFQGLTDRLGNRMATLVSLNFGHYFLKEGLYTLIGAETAQGLPNTQIYYSFIRGAGKQYGVPWFGNASVWNRWGWKNYSGVSDYNGGETRGTSLSLLKRLIYTHIMYNCSAVGFESSFLDGKDKLSPVGKIQQSANKWVEKNGSPGILYTPVAVMLDFFSGWTFPRHLYSNNIFRVWGNLPYEAGDFLTDNVLDLLYPGYRDASFFHNEKGFITPTPYGDAADCILSDSPLWILNQYPVIITGGHLSGGDEIKDKLEKYVEAGGKLIITAGSLENISGGLGGIKSGTGNYSFSANSGITMAGTKTTESSAFDAMELQLTENATVLASCENVPLAIEKKYGAGSIIVFASPFGLPSVPVSFVTPKEDSVMETPFPMLSHVKKIIGNVLRGTMIFEAVDGASLITCRKGKGEYTLAVCNSSWNAKPFTISSSVGRIISVTELPLDCSERKAVGYLPESVSLDPGSNSSKTIGGGDIRIFKVRIEEKNIQEIPFTSPVPNPAGRGIVLRNISSLKEEILLRPTFFQHFDRVVIDWKYLAERGEDEISRQSAWIKNQGLKVMVDLSSGINLFPDLRLVENDSLEYLRSMTEISSLLGKMKIIGAGDLMISSHRTIENNFTDSLFAVSLKKTLKIISTEASGYGIRVHFRPLPGRFASDPADAISLVSSVNEPNLFVAPSVATIAASSGQGKGPADILKDPHVSVIFVAAGAKDILGRIYSLNLPVADSGSCNQISEVLRNSGDSILILDGIYNNKNEEYLDAKFTEGLERKN